MRDARPSRLTSMPKPRTLKRRRQRLRAKGRLLAQPGLLSAMDDLLKGIYRPALTDVLEGSLVLLERLQKQPADFAGTYYTTLPASLRDRSDL